MKKRIIAMLTLLVLLVGLTSTSLAATKPTTKLLNAYRTQTVKLGETIKFGFQLNSGSYTMKNDAFRAKLLIKIRYNSKVIGRAAWAFTGKQNYVAQAKIAKNGTPGKYKMSYYTYYRKSASTNWIQVNKASGYTTFRVRK